MPTKSGHTAAMLVSKVIGTPLFAVGGQKLGHVQDVMLDKLSDKLVFAVVASNRATSDGRRYLPVPWALLDYNAGTQGYVIGLSEPQLKNAPVFGLDELTGDDALPARELMNQFYSAI